MSTAYSLAFALSAVPYLSYLVGIVFGGIAAERAVTPKSKTRVVWPFIGFSVLAFGLAAWHQFYLGDLFGNTPNNLDVESKRILGVDIPLELGDDIFDFVDSVFGVLVQLILVGFCIAGLFHPPPNKTIPVWVSRIVLVSLIGVLAVTGWPELVSALEGWWQLF